MDDKIWGFLVSVVFLAVTFIAVLLMRSIDDVGPLLAFKFGLGVAITAAACGLIYVLLGWPLLSIVAVGFSVLWVLCTGAYAESPSEAGPWAWLYTT